MNDLMLELDQMVEAQRTSKAKAKGTSASTKPHSPAAKVQSLPQRTVAPEQCDLHPIARVAYIGEHHCPECGRVTRMTSALAIRYSTKQGRVITQAGQWSLYPNLEVRIERLDIEILTCPACLREEEAVDDFIGNRPMQRPLWGGL